jgi:hypothetical protein
VGRDEVDRVLGVVLREPASRGVIATPGGFTEREHGGARRTADEHPAIELLGLDELVVILNEMFGPLWPVRLQSTVSRRRREFA